MMAEGLRDLHVKTGKDQTLQKSTGHVWDNAADFIILQNAGGTMLKILDGQPMSFEQGRGKQPAYIAFGDRDYAQKIFPEFRPSI